MLGICCILTALSLNNSITRNDLLKHEASELQNHLNHREQLIYSLLADKAQTTQLQSLKTNSSAALAFIEKYRSLGINLLIYQRGELHFWSSYKVLPKDISRIKEGTSFLQMPNGYYTVIKKTDDNFTYLFFIIVKNQYSIQNQYLENSFASEIFANKSLNLADFTDKNSKEVLSVTKKYLFSVKLSGTNFENIYTITQLWLWIAGIICICLFVNSFCVQLAKKGYWAMATLIIATFFITLRLSDLKYFWLNKQLNLNIFNPNIYAQSDLLPSLGDLLLNVIATSVVMLFAYAGRFEYRLPKWLGGSKPLSVVFCVFSVAILGYAGFLTEDIFSGLILNSKIDFDITNIINLSWVTWLCIFILCLVWFNIYLLTELLLALNKQLSLTFKQQLIVFLTMLAALAIYNLLGNFTVYFLIFAGFLLVLAYNNYIENGRFSIAMYALIFMCMASLSSLKYIRFVDLNERRHRATLAERLVSEDDPKVTDAIRAFEEKLPTDSIVISYFKQPLLIQTVSFNNYIVKNYLDGYLSRFEAKIYEYNSTGGSLKLLEGVPLDKYKNLVTVGAFKTDLSKYFYRINDTFGYQNYFGIIPIFEKRHLLGTVVIDLKSQPYDYTTHFPDLLVDGKLKNDEDLSIYSFAFYKNRLLYSQSGKYAYPMLQTRFYTGKADTLIFKNSATSGTDLAKSARYSHAIYQPDGNKVIVITKEKFSYVGRLATLSFFFIVFILFAILAYSLLWLAKNSDVNRGGWFSINRYLMINANRILYKTRIQLSIVLAVVATLIIIGWTTFFNLSREYTHQQEDMIREKLRKVQLSYEKLTVNRDFILNDEEMRNEFVQFADANVTFLNLYDTQGNLYLTSLNKLYDAGIIGYKMGPLAYIHLHQRQQSEFINPKEKIGKFTYAAAYAPIRNAQNRVIAYIGMPYYANEAEYQAKMGLFLNTLINIYALVFVLIGILAVFLANQITNPLNFIQGIISKTKLGQKNEPLVWHRQDEIGSLVKEYNKMIAALELSANKLARSERESAWREMAKQVAHEIKNPLTPLKLGVQLLERSWREKDPNFEAKFEKFSKSFLEQIDSLATIAAEFSNFAKMPETKLERLELASIITQAAEVFKSWENAEILILDHSTQPIIITGDKDQLLRTFNNLLKNAIEAMDEGKKCTINIHIANDSKNAFVEVEDNGKGIEKVLQDKIFTPNFTTKSSGTGLGLAFVKQATENAGGTITFRSAENVGTTFYLTYPLA